LQRSIALSENGMSGTVAPASSVMMNSLFGHSRISP
jgi:hypothetical protein